MNAVKTFNGLNGATVSRKRIESLIAKANNEGQFHLVKRLEAVLSAMGKKSSATLKIADQAFEIPTKAMMYGLEYQPETGKFTGLGKAFSQNDVYQKIADKMIAMIKEASGNGYKKKWNNERYLTGYTIPFNFDTKKRYRGVNVMLLTEFGALANPFFMSKKQIEKHKGALKKSAPTYEIVYYTKLFKVENRQKKLDFSSYKLQEAIDFAIANGLKEDDVFYLPILKWHEVFNGADITGIDFDLNNFKIGYINKEMPSVETLPIAEAILNHFPKPQPRFSHGGNRAFYNSGNDSIKMPFPANFETIQDYYRIKFHEYAHSTGHYDRLFRDFTGRFGSKKYAKEELIAEWGATFLSAEAGIIWHTNKNHAEYLKNWNAALTHIKDDNRFVMQACTAAQKLADYILQFDDQGNPKYYADLKKEAKKEKPKTKIIKKSPAPKKLNAKKREVIKEQFKEFATARVEGRKPTLITRRSCKRKKSSENNGQYKLLGPSPESVDITQSKPTVTDLQNSAAQSKNESIEALKVKGFISAADVPAEAKDVFVLPGEIGKFLQKIQPHKALILIKGTKHTSKSQLAMQIADAFGQNNMPAAYIDNEQGGMESKDTIDSINRNTTPKGRQNIAVIGFLENPLSELREFCKHCSVIIADSATDLKITADQLNDLRVHFPKVIWVFIVQVKENGEMYGGNKMAHNPTVIVKCHPSENPEERFATLEKNRGNDLSLEYSMFHKKLIEKKSEPENVKEEKELKPNGSKLNFTAVEIN